ncbi:cytosolic carboxypeptidase 2 isoform X1 [Anguilla rostrata]|uniref:cytosolic carboxypeptidase 2 isoform X1 n=1 Tax=Anguilla rostrata TaxID=7938 RepID=UPI0030CF4CC2
MPKYPEHLQLRPAVKTDTEMQIFVDPYENFMLHHLRHYGLFTDQRDRVKNSVTLSQTWERDRDIALPPRRDKNSPSSSDSDSDLREECIVSRRPCSLPVEPVPRSRQLVFDPDQGFSIPRLREPQGLFASLSLANLPQGVRWPVECQVIKEEVQHIEWEPPQPEPFYQPTGHERTPLPVGEEKGKVVYHIEPATKTSYFTYARVGGSRGPIRDPTGGWRDSALEFESRFESGNLQKAVQTGLHDYELTLRTDLYTDKHTQWFYFRVRNMKAGATYRFTIVNLMKPSSLYGLGMRPLLYSERAAAAAGGAGWRRAGADIRYYGNQTEREGHALYSLTWTCQFPYEGDTCYFAHCYPYTYSDLRRFLASVTSDPVAAALCKVRVLCRSLAGNAVYVLTVTSPSASREAARAKRAVVLTARVHPGETVGSWAMQGLLGYLLGDSADARLLRDAFVFKLVPMLNPDGVVVGNYRCSLAGRDPNRNYRTVLREAFPCVWHTRNMVKRVLAEREVVLFCDFHGHSRKNNVFMYGCENRGGAQPRFCERVFPLMMSKNAGSKFSYRSCKFRVQKSKEGTGRVVMWKLGVANSYTMESTFGGSTLGNRKGTHFSTQDLKSLGYHFCDTLLDFCDPDPTKVTACLAELAAMRREARLRLGGGYDASLSDASASDLESSTSGSNSTDSNDLPAHLLNIIDKEISCKKKRLKTRKERTRLRQERALSNKAKISPLALKHNASVVPGEGKTENQVAAVNDSKREKREFHLEAVTATYLHFEGPVDTTQPPDGRAELEGRACRKFPLRSVSSQPRQPYLHRQLLPSPCGLDHEPNSTARGRPRPPARPPLHASGVRRFTVLSYLFFNTLFGQQPVHAQDNWRCISVIIKLPFNCVVLVGFTSLPKLLFSFCRHPALPNLSGTVMSCVT